MAAAAVESEFAIVDVVGTVAVTATPSESCLDTQRLPMAVVAGDVDVSTVKDEVRLQVMVELPLLPVDRVVARGTVRVESATMRIVLAMTLDAGSWCIGKDLRVVAFIAFDVRVRPEQREAGEAVIEEHIIGP